MAQRGTKKRMADKLRRHLAPVTCICIAAGLTAVLSASAFAWVPMLFGATDDGHEISRTDFWKVHRVTYGVFVGLMLAGLAVAALTFRRAFPPWRMRCPECGEARALAQTGKAHSPGDGAGTVLEEWACLSCGHEVWIPAPHVSSGGG